MKNSQGGNVPNGTNVQASTTLGSVNPNNATTQDGGVLIGKVYGHLAETHKKAQALKLNFEPVVMKAGT